MQRDHREEAEQLLATLARYLSDDIAPMIFVDSADRLLSAPPEVVAIGVRGWVSSQLRGAVATNVADLLYHAAKKLHLLAELELVPLERIVTLIRGLRPHLLEVCPVDLREQLDRDLERLGETEILSASRPEVLHRALRDEPSSAGIAPPPSAGSAGVAAVPGEATAAAATAMAQGLDRLSLLLERLSSQPVAAGPPARLPASGAGPAVAGGGLADADTPPSGIPVPRPRSAGTGEIEGKLLAEVLAEVARTARSNRELENQLGMLRSLGVPDAGRSPLRTLAQALPDWAPRPGQEAPFGAVKAMRQIVDLARENDAVHQRFGELVVAAVEEFNSGSLGRAVTLVDLARRMTEDGTVDESTRRNVVRDAFPKLDGARLRGAAEAEEQRHLLRRFMAFFPQLEPDELLSQLELEGKRDQRRTIIALLSAVGRETRVAALATLRDGMAGTRPLPWHFERNLVYLLRTIPRADDEPIDPEIDVLSHGSELAGPLPLVREALAALGQVRHDRAETTLAARVLELEQALLGVHQLPHESDDLLALLDSSVALLARSPTSLARAAVVAHGLKHRPQLGDTLGRLARLGSQNLAGDPELVDRLVSAIRDELPRKVLGVVVSTARRSRAVTRLIETLAGTDTPAVRQVLSDISSQYAGQPFAEPAARTLAQLGSPAAEETRPSASLSGDLQLFGLPNLLQNLADSQLGGVLTLFDNDGAVAATITIARGVLVEAKCGNLIDESAVYQLLERPSFSRFVFVNREESGSTARLDGISDSITAVLLEGMRRYDELQRAAALVPGNLRLRPTGRRPGVVPDERDVELTRRVWQMAAEGRSPDETEASVAVDSYRVRRLFEHWFTEGALAPDRSASSSPV